MTDHTARPDPIAMMIQIAERFLAQAQEFDERSDAAVDLGASQGDIIALRNLADTSRLRALAACAQAAPYCSPKLSAVELAPMTEPTVSKFERAIGEMDEQRVLQYLDRIKTGTLRLEHLGADADAAA